MIKFGKKLGSYEKYKELKESLTRVIYESVRPEEFDTGWLCVVEGLEASHDEWLEGTFI